MTPEDRAREIVADINARIERDGFGHVEVSVERIAAAIREAEERGARWALEKLTPENDDHDESCESDWDNQAHCATPCGCRSREAARIVRAAREQEAR